MNMKDIVLWGVPILGLANGIRRFIKWLSPGISEKALVLIGAFLVAAGFPAAKLAVDLAPLYPALAEWGPIALWAIVAFLTYTGNYAETLRVAVAAQLRALKTW